MGLRLAALFVVGTFLGSLVNWAIYTLAWNPRPISPWSPPPKGAAPRSWFDRLPVFGWLQLRRESEFHGRWFWLRPLLLEIATGATIAALYWWEIGELGLLRGQFAGAINPPLVPLHFQFLSHVLLLCLMLAASFIDIDEKIIPDEITVPGTVLGLGLAAAVPLSLLPQIVARAAPPLIGTPVAVANNQRLWLEPVTAVAPNPWPPEWGAAGNWQSLVVALACYWLWCFALTPRIWRGRRGSIFALRLIAARVRQAFSHRPIRELFWGGTAVICLLWILLAQAAWAGLLTALIGLAASGGIVWAVRLIGTAALRREAMGFGDVTLMMMIGTFIGWQAGLVAFFLAPFAGLVIGLFQFALRRDDVIPYGPFLCLGSAVVIVAWAPIWEWAAPLFGQGVLVPAVLIICLALLGIMLAIWQAIKNVIFGRGRVKQFDNLYFTMGLLGETVVDFDAGRERVRARRYGVVEIVSGELAAVHLRPWPKLLALPEILPLGPRYHASGEADHCLLYYNQPWRMPNYLALKYMVSTLGTSYATFRAALTVLDAIATIKQSDAILCDAANVRITDRLLARFGWEPHKPERWHRNFIRRFYGNYPAVRLPLPACTA